MKTVEEVNELRQVICDYYARRVDDEVDKLWESGQWNDEKNEAVLSEFVDCAFVTKGSGYFVTFPNM